MLSDFQHIAPKFCCRNQERHRWRPRVFSLWSDRDDRMEPAIVSVVPIVSKFLETTGTIGTIRTIIWKPAGFKDRTKNHRCTSCKSERVKMTFTRSDLHDVHSIYRPKPHACLLLDRLKLTNVGSRSELWGQKRQARKCSLVSADHFANTVV